MKEWIELAGELCYACVTNKFLALAIGGAAGTHLRYWMSRWLNEMAWARGFPIGTFAVNAAGSFLLGFLAVLLLERLPPAYQSWYLLLGTGFCGGFTTFSTFEWETLQLVRDGDIAYALLNVAGSVLVGFLGVLAGAALGGLVVSGGAGA